MKYKGECDDFQAADETYIKVNGKHNYIWFYLSAENRKITSYHHSDNREVLPAITSMKEALRTVKDNQKAIGLQNLDSES